MIYVVIIAIIALAIIIASAIESRANGDVNEHIDEMFAPTQTVIVVKEAKKKWDPIHDYTHRHDAKHARHKRNQTPW